MVASVDLSCLSWSSHATYSQLLTSPDFKDPLDYW